MENEKNLSAQAEVTSVEPEAAQTANETEAKEAKEKVPFGRKILTSVFDFASVMASSLVTIAIVFTLIFRFVGVSGSSMVPTLYDGQWLAEHLHTADWGTR